MKKRDKLHKVNKWNTPFAQSVDTENNNIFGSGGFDWSNLRTFNTPSNIIQPSPIVAPSIGTINIPDNYKLKEGFSGIPRNPSRWESLAMADATANPSAYQEGVDITRQYQNSTNKLGISKIDNPFSKGNINDTLKGATGIAGSIAGQYINKALGKGYNHNVAVADTIRDFGNTASSALMSINPLLGAASFVGVNTLTGLAKAAWGHGENDATTAAVKAANNNRKDIANLVSRASSTQELVDSAAMNTGNMNISKSGFKNGWLNKDGDKAYNNLLAQQENAQNMFAHSLMTGANNVDSMTDDNAMINFLANGGSLGGTIQSNGAEFTTGLTRINAGGSHEENPYDGVQVGISRENGQPNLVEEGETIFDDYVYSKRIKLDNEAKKKFKFGGRTKGLTYADASEKIEKESLERPNDPISQRGLKKLMSMLADEQERQKSEEKAKEAQDAFAQLSPEQQMAIMQQLSHNPMTEQPGMYAEGGNIDGDDEPWYAPLVSELPGAVVDSKTGKYLGNTYFGYKPNKTVGGGNSAGGGAGVTNFKTDLYDLEKKDTTYVAGKEDFNTAFANARKAGLKTFEFNGKVYNTNLGGGKGTYEAGKSRTRNAMVPVETTRQAKGQTKHDADSKVKQGWTVVRKYEDGGYIDSNIYANGGNTDKEDWMSKLSEDDKKLVQQLNYQYYPEIWKEISKTRKQGLEDLQKLLNVSDEDKTLSLGELANRLQLSNDFKQALEGNIYQPIDGISENAKYADVAYNNIFNSDINTVNPNIKGLFNNYDALANKWEDSYSNLYNYEDRMNPDVRTKWDQSYIPAFNDTASTLSPDEIKRNVYKDLGFYTDSDFNNWAAKNKLNSEVDWSNIRSNADLMTAIGKESPILRNSILGGYRFEPKTEATAITPTFDWEHGSWGHGNYNDWKESTDPGWLEIKDKIKEGATSADIAKALSGTDAYKRTTDWLQNEDNRLQYLQGILNSNSPQAAKDFVSKYVDANGWKEGAARDYKTIFEKNRTGNAGTFFKSIPADFDTTKRESTIKNYVLGDNNKVEELIGELPKDWKSVGSHSWTSDNKDITYNYYQKPVPKEEETTTEEEETYGPNIKPVHSPVWGRYVGLTGPGVGLAMQLAGVGKPNYTELDSSLNYLNNSILAGYHPLANDLRYKPTDMFAGANMMNANARATDRAITNNAGPIGTKMAGLLASGYNSQLESADLFKKAEEYNSAREKDVFDARKAIQMANAENYAKTSATNAEILNNKIGARAQMARDIAQQKLANNASWYSGIYGNMSQLFKGLSDWGKENAENNTLANMAADTIFGTITGRQNIGKGYVKEDNGDIIIKPTALAGLMGGDITANQRLMGSTAITKKKYKK